MKRTILLLSVAVIGLPLFGWGCGKQSSVVSRQLSGNDRRTTTTAKQFLQTTTTTYDDRTTTPLEPMALGYLQLTQGASATVLRDGESTEAANDMELYAGDTVEVTAGEINILYPDTGKSFIEAPAKFTIMPDENSGPDGLGTRLLLEAGKVWTRLERLLGKEESFSVEASNVVATVRGTAFGVSLANGKVEVSVAESQVKVIGQTILNTGKTASSSVLIAAGNAIMVDPRQLVKTANLRTVLQRQIRKLTDAEKQDLGYIFALRKFAPGSLAKPANPFRWAVPPVLDNIRDRLQSAQLKRWDAMISWMMANRNTLERAQQLRLEQQPSVHFAPPLRQILQSELAAPTTTPQVLYPPTSGLNL